VILSICSHIRVKLDPGVDSVDVDFQFLSPETADEGRVQVSTSMLNLEWTELALYPAGYFMRRITVEPSVRLPEGWHFGTALEIVATSREVTTYRSVTLEDLMDSPLFAGRFFEQFDLDPGGTAPVRMVVFADRQNLITVTAEQLADHRALVQQAYRLFGSRHFDHYDFLVGLSGKLGGQGLEHLQSSENETIPGYFTQWETSWVVRNMLPHELAHSWNGKFRRPADQWTPNLNEPMRNSLLWVYEGQNQYWDLLLTTRSGIWTKQQALDVLADHAALELNQAGRAWRPLSDTTNDPIIAMRRPLPWVSWQSNSGVYGYGQLNWLNIDMILREGSGGRISLDDFARAFFGVNPDGRKPLTYTFEDVVQTLSGLLPFDWGRLIRSQLYGHDVDIARDGLTRGGYRLVYNDKPSSFIESRNSVGMRTDLSFSLGITLSDEGELANVQWDSTAYKAGLTVGTKIVAVNGDAYSAERLKREIEKARTDAKPLQLQVEDAGEFRTVVMDYHDGLRYPHLERIEGRPALLDLALAPKP
jgi:predicted metalloprotease with PDZ domain